MAWTSPITFVANNVLTAAQLNTNLRDNLNETAPAKATAAGRIFVATGANVIAERVITDNAVSTSQTTTSTTYTDLATAGPAVTLTTGTQALVMFHAYVFNSAASNTSHVSVAVSGATTLAASDNWALSYESTAASDGLAVSVAHLFTGLTAGSNTFTLKYRVTAGTGTFAFRDIVGIGL